MSIKSIQSIPTEAEVKNLLGELWDIKQELVKKERVLHERRRFLWKQEHPEICMDDNVINDMERLALTPEGLKELAQILKNSRL